MSGNSHRQNIAGGAIWEEKVGYSRAVRTGNLIEVAGTTAVIPEAINSADEVYRQCCAIFEKIGQALKSAGGSLTHVTRTRAYITDISRWEEYARAHAEFFGSIRPVTTLVEVSGLIEPAMLIEIEATAFLHDWVTD